MAQRVAGNFAISDPDIDGDGTAELSFEEVDD
jgi:hypothetical protein